MNYFSRRNQHIVEFSGYEEASPTLRQRLLVILEEYVGNNPITYNTDAPWFVEMKDFYYEVQKEFPGEDPFKLVEHGEFHQVFTVIEIFLDMAANIDYTRWNRALNDTLQAFKLSGSVYTINNRRVELIIDENLAKKIEEAKTVLSIKPSAYEKFLNGVRDLVGRKAKAEDIIKDIFIAFEDYLKSQTFMKNFGEAIKKLEKDKIISPTQKGLLDKIYAYRSDTYGVGHAGKSRKPDEIDALWFLETVIPQILLIDRRLKQPYEKP